MKKRVTLFAFCASVIVLSAFALVFLRGWWIPNEPSRTDFPIRGLDVSAHQGSIDWKQVKASGMSFVYLKATEGGDFQDANFADNLKGAREAGLVCGAYHFFSLKTPGLTQAQNFIRTVPRDQVTLPPVIDLEFWGNSSARPTPEAFQSELHAYENAIKQAYGQTPLFYTSSDFSDVYLQGYLYARIWARDIFRNPHADGMGPFNFWQYSDRGRLPGICGFVDLDVFHGSEDDFLKIQQPN